MRRLRRGQRLRRGVIEVFTPYQSPPHVCDVPAGPDFMGRCGPGTVWRCDCGQRWLLDDRAHWLRVE